LQCASKAFTTPAASLSLCRHLLNAAASEFFGECLNELLSIFAVRNLYAFEGFA
jgi:hypothetical protein